jgi:hypothetical protein
MDILLGNDLPSPAIYLQGEDAIDHEEGRSGQTGVKALGRVFHQPAIGKGDQIGKIKALPVLELFIFHSKIPHINGQLFPSP